MKHPFETNNEFLIRGVMYSFLMCAIISNVTVSPWADMWFLMTMAFFVFWMYLIQK